MDSRRSAATFLIAAAAAVWSAVIWSHYLPAGLVAPWDSLRDGFPLPWPPKINAWWIDFAGAALLALSAYGVGSRIASRLRLDTSGVEHVLVSSALGFTTLILVSSSLGLIGLFRPSALKAVVAIFVGCGAGFSLLAGRGPSVRRDSPPPAGMQAKAGATGTLLLCIVAFFLLCALALAAMPEVSPDGLQSHLLYPQYFLARGSFYFADPYRSNLPLYEHVLYAIGIVVHGFGLARFLQFLSLPAAAACTWLIAARMPLPAERRAPAAMLAVAALVSSPVVLLYSTRSYPDLPVALWESLAIYCAIRGPGAWPLLAGVFAGMAAGTKYAGLYGIPLIAVVSGAGMWARNRRAAISTVLLAGSLAIVVASPWYIRNWINTGDPLYPALHRHVGKQVIEPAESENLMRDARNPQRLAMTPGNFARLPWILTMDGNRFSGSVGPFFLWVLPFIVVAASRNRMWMTAAAAVGVLSMLWMIGPQFVRYYLPVLPFLAALGAHAIYRMERRWARAAALAAALASFFVNLPAWHESWAAGGIYVAQEIPFDIAFGRRPVSDFQREHIRGFTLAEHLNAGLLPDDARVMPVYSSELPRAIVRQRVLDVFEAHRIVCRDAGGNWTPCYRVGPDDLRYGMETAGVTALSIRRETRDLAETGALTLEDTFLRTGFRFLEFAGDTYLFERRRGKRVIGERYLQYDLLARLAIRTDVELPAENQVGIVNLRPRGSEMRPAMVVLPGGEVRFTLQLGDKPELAFCVGMDPAAARVARGAIIEVLAGAEPSPVFFREFHPRDALRGCQSVAVDLSRFSNREIVLTFRTRSSNPPAADWIAIAEPVIFAHDAGEALPTAPWMVAFDRYSLTAPLDVLFNPPRIHPGEYYTVSIPALRDTEIDIMAGYAGKPPDSVLRWTRLDASGRARLFVPPMAPGVMQVHAVRPSGARRWLAARGSIELLPQSR